MTRGVARGGRGEFLEENEQEEEEEVEEDQQVEDQVVPMEVEEDHRKD